MATYAIFRLLERIGKSKKITLRDKLKALKDIVKIYEDDGYYEKVMMPWENQVSTGYIFKGPLAKSLHQHHCWARSDLGRTFWNKLHNALWVEEQEKFKKYLANRKKFK